MQENIKIVEDRSHDEISRCNDLFDIYSKCPIPDNEILSQLGLFISKTNFARMLYIHEVYKKILDVHGIIIEFGVRWGQNLVLFETLRGIYEPFNRNRKIVGFDTFEGFPSVSAMDGKADVVSVGSYNVTNGYELYLDKLLDIHEQEGAISYVKGYKIIKGDATVEVEKYLKEHPATIISLAYFDLDLYEPTHACLRAIMSYLTRGSIIAFDELNYDTFPGETLALKEVLGLDKYQLVHTPFSSMRSYFVID